MGESLLADWLKKWVTFWLPLDKDVELLTSPAPSLPVHYHDSHNDISELTLWNCKPAPIENTKTDAMTKATIMKENI